jgi:hypothetical protein
LALQHHGAKRGGKLVILCSIRGGRGRSSASELIHVDGFNASTILYRQGGENSTSTAEAKL